MRALGPTALALLLLACGGAGRRDTDLNEVLRRYNEAVRWQNYETAAAWIPVAARDAWLDERRVEGETRRVTEYAVRRVRQTTPPFSEAVVRIEMGWYDLADPTLRNEVRFQRWRFEENHWWMVEETATNPAQKGMGSSSKPPSAGPGPESPQPPPPP